MQLLLEQGDDGSPQHSPPQVACAAHHGHEQVFNTNVQVERCGVDEALHVRVEPARNGRQQSCQHKQLDAVARGIDAHGLGHDATTLEGTNGAAFTRIEQVVHQPHRHQQHGPNEHAQHARIGQGIANNGQGWHAGDTRLPPQELHVAKQVVQAQAPSDSAQGQVVARELQSDRAQRPGNPKGQYQANQQTHPWQATHTHQAAECLHSGRRSAGPGGGVSANAHKRGLAKRGHATHAGEHDQPHGNDGVQADVAHHHHGELRQQAPGDSQQRHGQGRELRACQQPAGGSSG